MTTNIPAQPEAPDYGAATKEGIFTDIETMATRRGIENAARLGSLYEYVDPRTGEKRSADFRGTENWEAYAKRPELQQWYKEATARGEKWDSMEAFAKDYYNNIGAANGDTVERINSGSDAELQKIATNSALEANQRFQEQQLALRQQLGVANAEQTRKELEATDPEGFKARESLVAKLRSEVDSAPSAIETDKSMGDVAGRMKGLTESSPGVDNARFGKLFGEIDSADSGRLGQLFGEYERRLNGNTDQSSQARRRLLEIAMADADRGGKLDEASRNEVIQASRAGMAARGNFLGNSAAVAESMEVGQKAEDRRIAALGRLAAAQAQGFGQESQLLGQMQGVDESQYGRNTNKVAMGSNLLGQQFGQQQAAWNDKLQGLQGEANYLQAQAAENRATRQENYGRDQQKLANISSMILGQPISNQFGNLGAAQQGAVGFQNIGYKSGVGIDPSAGANSANFAQQNYSQAANMWQTRANIAQQDNAGMMSMVSGVGGAALGAMM